MGSWQPGMTLADVEKATILHAFRHFRGNKTQTAQALGITVKTIYNKLESYGMKAVAIGDPRLEENKLVPINGHIDMDPLSKPASYEATPLDIPVKSVEAPKQKAAGGKK